MGGRAGPAPLARKPVRLAADLEHSARELREKIVPASDIAGLDLLDARAAELAGAAETITGLLAASHAGRRPRRVRTGCSGTWTS